jgi:hypothetical protein
MVSPALGNARRRHSSTDAIFERSDPPNSFQAPCVSPPVTTMLMSFSSNMVTSSSGLALSLVAHGSTPASAIGFTSVWIH